MGDIYGKKGMLDKKLATSSKYEKVKSKVNTGKTVKHVETVSD